MRTVSSILTIIISLCILFASSTSEAQLPIYQDEFSIQAPDKQSYKENYPQCDYQTYIHCEVDEPCLGIFTACSGEINLSSPSDNAIYFYVWSEVQHKIEADGNVDQSAGDVILKNIRWQWWDNGWNDICYNNSGDFNNFRKKLKSVGGGIYKLKFRVYPEKVKIECDAQGDYYFTAKLEVIYPI